MPSYEKGIDVAFLRSFRSFLLPLLKTTRFILVAGGGKVCRHYQKSARAVVKLNKEDLDWLGIHATRLNAHLVRTIFREQAHPWIMDYDIPQEKANDLKKKKVNLFVASGWGPGWSTDYIAVKLAQKFGTKDVIVAGDTSHVYDKDPNKFKNAKPIDKISWKDYKKLVPSKWIPGLSTPVDPVATKLAEKLHFTAKILNGKDLLNFKKAIQGKEFIGTIISA